LRQVQADEATRGVDSATSAAWKSRCPKSAANVSAHIELASPWFTRVVLQGGCPAASAILLDISLRGPRSDSLFRSLRRYRSRRFHHTGTRSHQGRSQIPRTRQQFRPTGFQSHGWAPKRSKNFFKASNRFTLGLSCARRMKTETSLAEEAQAYQTAQSSPRPFPPRAATSRSG